MHQFVVMLGMHFELVEARHNLLNLIQLLKRIPNQVLVVVLHLLEFVDNIMVAVLLSGLKTLPEVPIRRVDRFVEDDNFTECSEVAE
ncbi:hypothetical protein [Haloarcula argentinensis]|uniref:hypothetical protein n=1 Tax=Haloarcula argentinensis TaxID=43776 RepID=UPI0002B04300|nr:hypothetical protein [Haloarcula argentinensis]EMA25165.1 hypothetical protein C443_03179 [Haloarcula argentinensis DSM 12282]